MIARIWKGRTHTKHYEEYTAFMKAVAIPDYKKTEGFVKLSFLRRIQGDFAHFTLITYWKNLEVIQNFAGADYDTAKYYPKDKNYLLEFEEKVRHFEVFAEE
jgi:heme-degrading monooxygenase HmoA